MMNLEGKTYIVTGSSMGIGEAIARRIVNLNGKVLIHGLETVSYTHLRAHET